MPTNFINLIIIFCALICGSIAFDYSDNNVKFNRLKSNASAVVQKTAALDVIRRFLPVELHKFFQVQVDFHLEGNTFKVLNSARTKGVVRIKGSSGTAVTRGFHYYLKYFLNCHVSWDGNQMKGLKTPFPEVNITITSPNKFIYYSNVCTHSYSFVWWKEYEWRQHLDWMAMQGVNLFIAPVQEEIWTRVYKTLKFTQSEIDVHLGGPAFLAWQRMGNIRGWGGPLSDNFKKWSLKMQKEVIKACRDLGMIVAIPGFAGHVPNEFTERYPSARVVPTSQWKNFDGDLCCPSFLDPTDDYFRKVAKLFLREVIKQYGTDHLYFCDAFNENIPEKTNLRYIRKISNGIYKAMEHVDEDAVWLVQGWMFRNSIWNDNMIRAFVKANSIGTMLILDLQSDQHPIYLRAPSFYGQPFIWCMLHNFGGTHGMHGSLDIMNSRPIEAKQMANSSMVGFGVTMEGIHQNYMIYEFAFEMGWLMKRQNLYDWLPRYLLCRYGFDDDQLILAWDILASTVYNYQGLKWLNGHYIFNTRPSINKLAWTWYDTDKIKTAWTLFLGANRQLSSSSLYRRDLVDVTRQHIQILLSRYYVQIINSFYEQNLQQLSALARDFENILLDLDTLLKTECTLTLGNWIETAKQFATHIGDAAVQDQYESNARFQITLWGPRGEITDYATKQWSGVVAPFFMPRWHMYFEALKTGILKDYFDDEDVQWNIKETIEFPFIESRNYSLDCGGDAIEFSKILYIKWGCRDTDLNLPKLTLLKP